MGGETDRHSPGSLPEQKPPSEEEGCWQQPQLPFRDVVRLLKREKSQKREEEDPFI